MEQKLQKITEKCNITVIRNAMELSLSDQEEDCEDQKYLKCASCEEIFTHSSYLKKHIRTVHKGHKDFKCEICQKVFTSNGSLKNHIKMIHEGRKDYKCEICEKEFSTAEFLKNHAKKFHGAKLKKLVQYVPVH